MSMNAAGWIATGLNLSIVLMVFSLALRAGGGSARAALGSSSLLLRSLFAMFVVMPALAVTVARSFDLNRQLVIALMLLALAPVPPMLPVKQLRAGGDSSYVMGLLVVSALAAIAIVPAGVEALGRTFGRDIDLPLSVTARVVGTSVLLPVIAGLALARLAPALAGRIAGPISTASSALLPLLFIPVLVSTGDAILAQVGNFTIVTILVFILAGLAVGHLLGGPRPDDRTSLALATATRHPGVAIVVLHAVAPEQQQVAPVLLLYLLVGMLVAIPYLKWRSRGMGSCGRAG